MASNDGSPLRYRAKADSFVIREIAGEEMLVPLNTTLERLFALNPAASLLIEALGDWKTEEELVAKLEDAFSAPKDEDIAAHVREYLGQLEKGGFIEVV